MKSEKRTLAFHQELGAGLQLMSWAYSKLMRKLLDHHNRSHPAVRAAFQVQNALNKLRSDLDNQLGKDCPEITDSVFFGCYYCNSNQVNLETNPFFPIGTKSPGAVTWSPHR
jgi:hypothetical protein